MEKVFVGVTALLVAFPPCLGAGDVKENQATQPLLTGSVCRVRDSLDFLDPVARAKVAAKNRVAVAKSEFGVRPTCHVSNCDEENVPLYAGNYHKSLPHDEFGQVDPDAYQKLLDCVFSTDINVCEQVPSGGGASGGAKLTNPLGGTAHLVSGADSDNVFITTPSALLSEELAAQQAEVYWMALARDVPFSKYGDDGIIELAAANLDAMPGFQGLNIPRSNNGKIDPVTDLFRTDWPGVTAGPVVSQLLLNDFIIDAIVVEPKQATLVPGMDYMTTFQAWLDVQNGVSKVETEFVDPSKPLFIRNSRDLATIAFTDLLYTEAFRAALILFNQGLLGGSVGPYAESDRQIGFATFGAPHILTSLASSASSTRHAWYAKWQVHRVLRPEAYGGLVHNTITGGVTTPLPASLLANSDLLTRIAEHNAQRGERTFLLPMAVAPGSPTHPAYPSGHSVNVGAYITSIKAMVGFEMGQRCYPSPVISNDAGDDRIPYVPSAKERLDACMDESGKESNGLTYEGELNKVAANVIMGRSHIGVHWRMDGVYGALMGEISAIRHLQQELPGLPEARAAEERDDTEVKVSQFDLTTRKGRRSQRRLERRNREIPPATYSFRLFNGKQIQLYGANLYRLGDQLCKGPFTGDDFCDVVMEETFEDFDDIVEEHGTFSLHTEL